MITRSRVKMGVIGAMVVVMALVLPWVRADDHGFDFLFKGVQHGSEVCLSALHTTAQVIDCYSQVPSVAKDRCEQCTRFWHCVHHKSCGLCDQLDAIALYRVMQANFAQANCTDGRTDAVRPELCMEAAVNVTACYTKLDTEPGLSMVNQCKKDAKVDADFEANCDQQRKVDECVVQVACVHCDHLTASVLAVHNDADTNRGHECHLPVVDYRPNDCRYFHDNPTNDSSESELYEQCYKELVDYKEDTNSTPVNLIHRCQNDSNYFFNVSDPEKASIENSCKAFDNASLCINDWACKKCSFYKAMATLRWFEKTYKRLACGDVAHLTPQLECQQRLTPPPKTTFITTPKKTEKPTEEPIQSTTASSNTTTIIIVIVVVVCVIVCIAAACYFYWKSQQDKEKTKSGLGNEETKSNKTKKTNKSKVEEKSKKSIVAPKSSKSGLVKPKSEVKSKIQPLGSIAPKSGIVSVGSGAKVAKSSIVPLGSGTIKSGIAAVGSKSKIKSTIGSGVKSGVGKSKVIKSVAKSTIKSKIGSTNASDIKPPSKVKSSIGGKVKAKSKVLVAKSKA